MLEKEEGSNWGHVVVVGQAKEVVRLSFVEDGQSIGIVEQRRVSALLCKFHSEE